MGLWNKIQRKASKIRLHPKSRKQTKVETSDDDDDYFEARSTLSVDTVLLDVSKDEATVNMSFDDVKKEKTVEESQMQTENEPVAEESTSEVPSVQILLQMSVKPLEPPVQPRQVSIQTKNRSIQPRQVPVQSKETPIEPNQVPVQPMEASVQQMKPPFEASPIQSCQQPAQTSPSPDQPFQLPVRAPLPPLKKARVRSRSRARTVVGAQRELNLRATEMDQNRPKPMLRFVDFADKTKYGTKNFPKKENSPTKMVASSSTQTTLAQATSTETAPVKSAPAPPPPPPPMPDFLSTRSVRAVNVETKPLGVQIQEQLAAGSQPESAIQTSTPCKLPMKTPLPTMDFSPIVPPSKPPPPPPMPNFLSHSSRKDQASTVYVPSEEASSQEQSTLTYVPTPPPPPPPPFGTSFRSVASKRELPTDSKFVGMPAKKKKTVKVWGTFLKKNEPVAETIWKSFEAIKNEQMYKNLEEGFEEKPKIVEKKTEPVAMSSKNNNNNNKKGNTIPGLQIRNAFLLSLAVKNFKCPKEVLVEMVEKAKWDDAPTHFWKSLKEATPNVDELSQFSLLKSTAGLDDAYEFCFYACKVEALPHKITCVLYLSEIAEKLEDLADIKKKLTTIKDGANSLISSEPLLKKVIYTVNSSVNYLNQGTVNECAPGFPLASLSKFLKVKGNGITLAGVVAKHDGSIATELGSMCSQLKDCLSVDEKGLQEVIKDANERRSIISDLITIWKKDSPQVYDKCQKKVDELQKVLEEVAEMRKEVQILEAKLKVRLCAKECSLEDIFKEFFESFEFILQEHKKNKVKQ